ncbi:MAG: putative metal-dependent TIM-barrel fold hydrolase [Planctomycetota bacterium]|jgi:predicted metal-dependent TIM-barrel fold hydrolase
MTQKIFEPHAHMFSRVTDDYVAMYNEGIRVVLEPAFWLGQPRTNIGSFVDYFDTILGWERHRSEQFGIHHICTMALNPREANDDRVNDAVMEVLPRYLEKNSVVGVGEIGLDDMTEKEEKYFVAQIQLAIEHDLPILIHTPHRNKKAGFQRCLDIAKDSGIAMDRVLIDHGNEETVRITHECGALQGFSIYPNTKMTPERMVNVLKEFGVANMVINSACDWGVSDPLSVPKTVAGMRAVGFSEEDINTLVWDNPINFFGRDGRGSKEEWEIEPSIEWTDTFDGNSVLRGQDPKTM